VPTEHELHAAQLAFGGDIERAPAEADAVNAESVLDFQFVRRCRWADLLNRVGGRATWRVKDKLANRGWLAVTYDCEQATASF
jgi:hypothetical protein